MSNDKQAEQEKTQELPVTELSEDMEMMGPGLMLREARLKLSLSQEDIAKRLNFKASLVDKIEQDIFDPNLPATFNRGYLCSYAKIVAVDAEDVLASYDALGAANIQRSEMQSFSKETVKQAEHSRLMWISYLIVAVLVGLTIMWWLQDSKQQKELTTPLSSETKAEEKSEVNKPIATNSVQILTSTDSEEVQPPEESLQEKNTAPSNTIELNPAEVLEESTLNTAAEVNSLEQVNTEEALSASLADEEKPLLSTAVFTFSGDCWVNIYDDTGERIAWGVKKSGYVMTIQGKAPLKVTLGKPELASIIFNEQLIDMSAFNVGNIAKFTLPLTSN